MLYHATGELIDALVPIGRPLDPAVQKPRENLEPVFGWMKTVGGLRKLRHRGIALVDWQLTFAASVVLIALAIH